MTERKLDIFEVLNKINSKDVDFYDTLSPEEQNSLHPFVLMQWLVGTSDVNQIALINEFVNPVIFSLGSHKKLLWQLLTICNSGTRKRYQWQKLAGKSIPSRPTCTAMIMKQYNYGTQEAIEALEVLDDGDIISMAIDLGYPADELAKIKKELKK